MQRHRSPLPLILFIIAVAVLGSLAAQATEQETPPPAKRADTEIELGDGPPPWAPETGYGRRGAPQRAYVSPYGIDTGTCQRLILAAALHARQVGAEAVSGASREGSIPAAIGGIVDEPLLEGAVGQSMDSLDQGCLGQILEHAPAQRTVIWTNEDSEAEYSITPMRTTRDGAGRYCREYRTTVTIEDDEQALWGTACREADGSWRRS